MSLLLDQGVDKGGKTATDRMVSNRPPLSYPLMTTGSGSKIPMLPYPRSYAHNLAVTVDALRIPIDVLNRETIRNGFEILPYYRYECQRCGKEYHNKPIDPNFLEDEKKDKKDQKKAQTHPCLLYTSPSPRD